MTTPRPPLFDAHRRAHFLQLVGNGTPAHHAARLVAVPYSIIDRCVRRDPRFAAQFAEALAIARVEQIEAALWTAATEPREKAGISVRAAIALCETYLPERWINNTTRTALIKQHGASAVIDYLNTHDPLRQRHHTREPNTGIAIPTDPTELRRQVDRILNETKRRNADVNAD